MAWTSTRGDVYNQLIDHVPALKPLYTDFELHYEVPILFEKAQENWWIPVVAVALYILMFTVGPVIMKDRKPFSLKTTLAAWNLMLSLFSFAGALRTVPHLLWLIANLPLNSTICQPPATEWGVGATGFWVQMFIFSKIPELGDTVFLVLKKKPVIFLHWYHHITVLLYCWHAYTTEASQALYFVAMNYSVHAIMYGYYFLTATNLRPKWMPAWPITAAQLSQMVVGITIQVWSMVLYNNGVTCQLDFGNLVAGAIMYGSYFGLFLEFAIKRYVLPKKKKGE